MQQDMDSRNDVPKPHSPNSVPDFAHYDGDEVLHCLGGKCKHAPAVLVVYGKQLASPYSASVCSNIGY
jgi:hypothetical protein